MKKNIDNNNTNIENIDIENNEEFDKKLSKCIEKCDLFDNTSKNIYKKTDSSYLTEKEYQNSFSDIIAFSKSLTGRQKDNIDVVMFHSNNEDGLMSAYYTFKHFENKKELYFIPTKPSSSNTMLNNRLQKYDNILKNKNILILDLSFGKANYDYLSKLCKTIIIIDDHPRKNNILSKYKNIIYFIGDNMHCASVYTYKFFNPKIDVPLNLIYIDNNDRKLQLPFINRIIYRYLTVYNNFKIIHSPYLEQCVF